MKGKFFDFLIRFAGCFLGILLAELIVRLVWR